jgi:hypothetical protein
MLKYYNNTTKTLNIPYDFNEILKDIPVETKIIIFSQYTYRSRFNQEIKENVLPSSLHTLILGGTFNQEIKENVLPNSLHTLTFGWSFNQEIKENTLPVSLHTITFGFYFNQEIKTNVLPKSIKNIRLFSHNNFINNLPLQLEEVYIAFSVFNKEYDKEVNNLPITLEKITINHKKYLKNITKIPFGCDILIKDFIE